MALVEQLGDNSWQEAYADVCNIALVFVSSHLMGITLRRCVLDIGMSQCFIFV